MGQEQFLAIMPFISADLVEMIAQKEGISENQAIAKLYKSKLYSILEREETKLWHLSVPTLYELWVEEKETGHINYPEEP